MARRFASWSTCGLAIVLAAAGCRDSAGLGDHRISIHLTDAPDTLLASATVTIGRIDIVSEDEGPITLTSDGGTFDLLTLRDGITAELASLDVPAGRYRQLRLIVSSASVTLKDAYQFTDGSRTRSLKVPSGAQTGLKIRLGSGGDGLDVEDETDIVVDFDVAQNFVVQGNPGTPAGIHGFLFTPVLRAVKRAGAGSISGTVTAAAGGGLEGVQVRAERDDAGDLEEDETAVATDITDEDGNYTIRFLAPGTYTVTVEDVSTTPASRSVTVGNDEAVTGAHFTESP